MHGQFRVTSYPNMSLDCGESQRTQRTPAQSEGEQTKHRKAPAGVRTSEATGLNDRICPWPIPKPKAGTKVQGWD